MAAAGRNVDLAFIDSSVWIEYYHPKGSPAVRDAVRQAILEGRVLTSPVVAAEILQGARDDAAFQLLAADFAAYNVTPLDLPTAQTAAVLLRHLANQGRRVPVIDALIAASAALQGAELWHLSDPHFEWLAMAAAAVLPARPLRTRRFSQHRPPADGSAVGDTGNALPRG